MDAAVFQADVRHLLCPTLRPGDVVIRDNFSPHKSAPTLDLITATGAQIRFLPACSPDLNPIEKRWSKIKNFLRQVEARTEAALIEAIGAALVLVTPQDARNWFAGCGYSIIEYALAPPGGARASSPVLGMGTPKTCPFAWECERFKRAGRPRADPRLNHCNGRPDPLPAGVLTGPQPHREKVEQDQELPAAG